MATTRQQIRSDLRNDLRVDPNGKVWSDSNLNQLIHEGELEVARKNISIRELDTSTTFSTAIGDREYDLPNDLNRVERVIYDDETVAFYTASTIAFVDSNPDTITDSANGFVTAGFTSGMKLQIEGSTSNDVSDTLTIDTVAAGTITLVLGDSLTAEAAGTSISIVGRTDPQKLQVLRRVEDIRQLAPFNNVLGTPSRYAVSDGSFIFDTLPKEVKTVRVYYTKTPQLMSADSGATGTSDIPDDLIPHVRIWADYLAWNQIPGEENKANNALDRFEREMRRMIVMRNLDDYAVRQYSSMNWRGYSVNSKSSSFNRRFNA